MIYPCGIPSQKHFLFFFSDSSVLGWSLTLARLIPGVLVPPLIGWLGGLLYKLFAQRP